MSGKLRTAHPKVWAAVSDAKGEVPLRRPLLSYLKLNYGLVVGPEVDCEAACSLLVDKLSTRTSSAVSRWKLLKSALVSDETPSMAPSDASVRRVSTFGLLVSEPKEGIAFPLVDPLRFTFTRYNMRGLSVYGVAPRAVKPTLAQLVAHRSAAGGVDNTGNVCVWPCEEAIAYCAVGGEGPAWDITGRVVVELGSGALGLAGLLAAASGRPARVIITDGNEEASANAGLCVELNRHLGVPMSPVSCQRLVWGQEVPSALCGVADVILCADCLFFEDFHAGLLACCDALLKPVVPPGGPAPSVWALAPSRGGSLERFVGTAVRAGFDVCVRDGVCAGAVCAAAAANTAFDPDLHRPRMVILTRKA